LGNAAPLLTHRSNLCQPPGMQPACQPPSSPPRLTCEGAGGGLTVPAGWYTMVEYPTNREGGICNQTQSTPRTDRSLKSATAAASDVWNYSLTRSAAIWVSLRRGPAGTPVN